MNRRDDQTDGRAATSDRYRYHRDRASRRMGPPLVAIGLRRRCVISDVEDRKSQYLIWFEYSALPPQRMQDKAEAKLFQKFASFTWILGLPAVNLRSKKWHLCKEQDEF